MDRYTGPIVCLGGPMHGKIFDGGSYPAIDAPMPVEWNRAYGIESATKSLKTARLFATRYNRQWLTFKAGSLVLEGAAWVWAELDKDKVAVGRAAFGLMITSGFECLTD